MGWVIVRDALSIGPWRHDEERSASHRRSPTDHDADHVLLRLIECVQGSAEIKLDCEPAFDYGGLAADWSYTGAGYNEAVARSEGMDLELQLVTDLRLGFEGPRARARTTLHEGEVSFVALGWSKNPMPSTYEEAQARMAATRRFWQEWLKHGTFPGSPVALLPAAQRPDAQGPHLRAVRSDGCGRHDVAARDAGWRPQLGLSLQLDSRLDVHAVGAVHARLRRGGERLLLLRRRRRGGRGGAAAGHVRDRGGEQARGAGARASVRVRPRAPGAHRQRRLRPGAARRVGCGARLDLPAHQIPRSAARPAVADHQAPGRGGARALAGARPRHLGGARGAEALHLLEADVLGRSRPRSAPCTDPPRQRDGRPLGSRRRGDPRRHLRARAQRPRRVRAALRDRRVGCLAAADAAGAIPARPTIHASAPPCSRSPTS